MDEFVKVPSGKTLLELLGVKHEAPAIGQKSPVCASCRKPFNTSLTICGHVRVAPPALPAPVIVLYPLCHPCAKHLKQGGKKEDAVLAAVKRFMNDEVAQ